MFTFQRPFQPHSRFWPLVFLLRCSDIEEERFCKEPACDAQVDDWRTNPERPMPVEPFELQLTGANLTLGPRICVHPCVHSRPWQGQPY